MVKKESHMMSYGYNPDWSEGSVKPPIFQTSTFVFKNAAEGKRFFEVAYAKSKLKKNEQLGLIYSRLNNPNMQILEERLAILEGSESAAAFVSGMSAISTVMLAFLKPGDLLLINKLKMIYVETPANPTNTLIDLKMVNDVKKTISKKIGSEIISVCDNTYLGPIWQNPLEFGIDLTCYSATKFLNGHSDVIAGAVMGSKDVISQVKYLRTFLGGMIAPYTAWLLTRSLETLHVRMNYQAENSIKIVDFLKTHKNVLSIYYPGDENMDQRQNEIYKTQCTHGGAMVAFTVKGNEKGAFKFLDSLNLIKLAVSLGSNESLAQHPYSMTHSDVPDGVKNSIGITEGLIRLSVGIEYADDIISDLKQALDKI